MFRFDCTWQNQHHPHVPRRKYSLPWLSARHLLIGWVILAGISEFSRAQEAGLTRSYIDPRVFGFEVPPGKVVQAKGEVLLTHDERGAPTVAKLHVSVGNHHIVLLPDGKLVARKKSEATETDRKFEPLKKEELAQNLLTGQFQDFKTNTTRRYLYVYNTSENFALATSRIMETMHRGVATHAKSQKIPIHDPLVPMVVIMFRTEKEFKDYAKLPDGVIAFYDPVPNHVVMYEKGSTAKISTNIAIQQAISTIAHEGAHQILHNIGVQKRLSRWPMWISEGLAEYYAPTSTGKRLKWKGAGQVNDMRMFELEQFFKNRDKKQLQMGDMITDTVAAARLTSTGYASAWSLTHMLAKTRRAGFNGYVKDVSQLQPLEMFGRLSEEGRIQDNLVLFAKHFDDDYPGLEKRLSAHLNKLPYKDPFGHFPHYAACLALSDGRRYARVFLGKQAALQWISETTRATTRGRRVTSRFQIQPMRTGDVWNRSVAESYAAKWRSGQIRP